MRFIIFILTSIHILASCQSREKNDVIAPNSNKSSLDRRIGTSVSVSDKTISFLNQTEFAKFITSGKSLGIDWNRFSLKAFWKEDFLFKDTFTVNKRYYDLYGKLLRYSPDSSMFIDLDSYNLIIHKDKHGNLKGHGAGPDCEVSLINVNNKKQKRLIFLGPGSSITDAAWLDAQNFILLGYEESSDENTFHALMYKFDIDSQTGYLFKAEDAGIAGALKKFSKQGRLKHIIMR